MADVVPVGSQIDTRLFEDSVREPRMSTHSLDFYRRHAQRYSELSHGFIHSAYTECSHPALKTDMDLLNRLMELVPGGKGLDAGCGPGARDVHLLCDRGYDMYGLDAVDENIQVAKDQHPEIADRLQVADLQEPLPFPDASFDLALCNAVIQHIPQSVTNQVTLPELVRVLRPGGVLQLMFKNGLGVETVVDNAYGEEGVDRSFELYDENQLLKVLENRGCRLIDADPAGRMGGFLYFKDPKPMRYCVFWVRKS
jgi:SAM-dependent methyltransferase